MSGVCMGGCRDCPVRRAVDHAADDDGTVYFLHLHLTNGQVLRGPIQRLRDDGLAQINVIDPVTNTHPDKPTFVRCRDVSAARIEW